jgi:hypothetical protein
MRASIVIASLLVAGGSVGWAAAQAAGERIDATEGSLFLLGPTSLSTLDPESLDSLAWPEPPQADPELDPEVAAAEESAPFPGRPRSTPISGFVPARVSTWPIIRTIRAFSSTSTGTAATTTSYSA